jgi:hypothetical protein
MKEKQKLGSLELELDGHIYVTEKDKDGNIISREEIDGELVLKMLLNILEDAIRTYSVPKDTSEPEEEESLTIP